MEFIIEFILELVLEGSIEASQIPGLPKYIRYPLTVITALFFIAVIGVIFLTGILALKENILFGIFIIAIGLFILWRTVLMVIKAYLKLSANGSNNDL